MITRRGFSKGLAGSLLGPGCRLYGQTSAPQRLILIYLGGGWNTQFATDPVIGEKASKGKFEAIYKSEPITVVPGKSNLVVGSGWQPAAAAFAMVPTCFVNGVAMDVTVHEIGKELMVAGLSASLRSDAPSNVVTALLGDESAAFPEHLMLAGDMPNRTAKQGLSGSNIEDVARTLRSPSNRYSDEVWGVGQGMVKALNAEYRQRLGGEAAKSSQKWEELRERIFSNTVTLGAGIEFTPEIKSRYDTTGAGTVAGRMAGAFLALSSNLTSYVSVSFGGFDTHSSEMDTQLPRQKEVATAFSKLIFDLTTTPDPAAPQFMLIDTTTVYVTSEFARTPKFNGAAGTDHWPTASAILCGRGIIDNQVIGKTDHEGYPLGWADGKATSSPSATLLQPQDLVATLLRHFGRDKVASRISGVNINGIFA